MMEYMTLNTKVNNRLSINGFNWSYLRTMNNDYAYNNNGNVKAKCITIIIMNVQYLCLTRKGRHKLY